jgi:hypothetical protein
VKTKTESEKTNLQTNTKGIDVGQLANYCMKGLADATPPAFCWIKGGDAGVIPSGCPSGYFRSLALCYAYCRPGFDFVLGVCWELCGPGYTNAGLSCWKHIFSMHFKATYIPHILTNFSSKVPCPKGRFRMGALCYKNCGNIAMVNCLVGACARDKASCISSLINIVVDIVNAVVSAVTFVVSLGTSTAVATAKNAAFNGAKKMGLSAMGKIMKSVGFTLFGKFRDILKDRAIKIVQDHIRDSIIQGVSNQLAYTFCNTVITEAQAKAKKEAGKDLLSLDTLVSSLDFMGIKSTVDACQNTNRDGGASCAKGIVAGISNFDPTGLTTLISTFIHPVCDVPLEPARPIIPVYEPENGRKPNINPNQIADPENDLEKDIIKVVEEVKKVGENCIRLYDQCNFGGTYSDICSSQTVLPKLNNKVSSFQVGAKAHGLFFGDENYQGDYLLFAPQQSQLCLNDVKFGAGNANNIMSSIMMNGDECLFVYTTNSAQKTTATSICETKDNLNLSLADVKLLRVVLFKKGYKATFYDTNGYRGNWAEVVDSKPYDSANPPHKNYIRSIKFEEKVPKNCVRLFTNCNYMGGYRDFCKDTHIITPMQKQISGYIAGLEADGSLFSDPGYNGRVLEFTPGQDQPCLRGVQMMDVDADKKIQSVRFNTDECLIINVKQRVSSYDAIANNIICQDTPSTLISFNLLFEYMKLLLNKPQSKAILYTLENYTGESWTIENSATDPILEPRIDEVRSIKFIEA